jgi:hypothetical protein
MAKMLLCSAALVLSISAAQAYDEKGMKPEQWQKVYDANIPGHAAAIDMNNLLRNEDTGDVLAIVCPVLGKGMTCHVQPRVVKFTCDGTNLYTVVMLEATIHADPHSMMGLVGRIACRGRV